MVQILVGKQFLVIVTYYFFISNNNVIFLLVASMKQNKYTEKVPLHRDIYEELFLVLRSIS